MNIREYGRHVMHIPQTTTLCQGKTVFSYYRDILGLTTQFRI